jgi:hypothetical protein
MSQTSTLNSHAVVVDQDKPALHKELIEYFSKEIETHTNSLMTFRSRISFAGLFGPFLLLGSLLVATKQLPGSNVVVSGNRWLVAGGGLFLSYLALAWAGATVEKHIWRQCNRWRKLIAEIAQGDPIRLTAEQLEFKEHLRLGYLFCFGAMSLAFVAAVFLIRT